MPHITQTLLFIIINLKAKHSIISNSPQTLWTPIHPSQKKYLILLDWIDPHRVITLTFKVSTNIPNPQYPPLVFSFYYVDSRWQLNTPLEIAIDQALKELHSPELTPNLLTYIPSYPLPINILWKFIKQNDPDIRNLIINRIVSSTPFILPHSSFILSPLGITLPITSISPKKKTTISLDPSSSYFINKGHSFI